MLAKNICQSYFEIFLILLLYLYNISQQFHKTTFAREKLHDQILLFSRLLLTLTTQILYNKATENLWIY